jgi:hypothetical protein
VDRVAYEMGKMPTEVAEAMIYGPELVGSLGLRAAGYKKLAEAIPGRTPEEMVEKSKALGAAEALRFLAESITLAGVKKDAWPYEGTSEDVDELPRVTGEWRTTGEGFGVLRRAGADPASSA